jgi:ribulose-5-phosphate 4-epimerase/fuculose-1-phosphate aldolase
MSAIPSSHPFFTFQEAPMTFDSTRFDALRRDIAVAARILFRAGLSVGNAGHLSVAVGDNVMLVNHFGPSFATLRAENIVAVDFSGKILEGEAYVNDTIRLHGIIHRENPKAVAVVHTHPPSVVTWSVFRAPLEIFDQESCFLVDDVAVVDENYEGLASEEERVLPVATATKSANHVLLPNHGAITVGDMIQIAAFRMLLLEGMAQRNLAVRQAALATGLTPISITPEAARRTRNELARIPSLPHLWKDYLTRLRVTDPDLFEKSDLAKAAN